MKKYLSYIIKGFYAGLLIGMGGIVYLAVSNKIVGALLFSFGLFTVCLYSFNLYTGKIGYLLENRKLSYVVELLLSLVGNFLGTFVAGSLLRLTRYTTSIEAAQAIVDTKLSDTPLSIFILAVFCGIIMYIAVNNYKTQKDPIGKYAAIFMGVMVFILCGFEHCVANMFYFSAAGVFNWQVLGYLLLMILGNSVGSLLIAAFYNKYCAKAAGHAGTGA